MCQGGCLAAILAASILPFTELQFAIIIGAFKPTDVSYGGAVHQVDVPSLHVWGTADTMVVPSRSIDLASCFVDSQVSQHSGGHFTPTRCGELELQCLVLSRATPHYDLLFATSHYVVLRLIMLFHVLVSLLHCSLLHCALLHCA